MQFPRTLTFAILILIIAMIAIYLKGENEQGADSKLLKDWREGAPLESNYLCRLILVDRYLFHGVKKEETKAFILNLNTEDLLAVVTEYDGDVVQNDFSHSKQFFDYTPYFDNDDNCVTVKLELLKQVSWVGDFNKKIQTLRIDDAVDTSQLFAIAATFPNLESVFIVHKSYLESKETTHSIKKAGKVTFLEIESTKMPVLTFFRVLQNFPSLHKILLKKVPWKSMEEPSVLWEEDLYNRGKFVSVLSLTTD